MRTIRARPAARVLSVLPGHADSRSLEAMLAEELRVLDWNVCWSREAALPSQRNSGSRGIAAVEAAALHYTQRYCCVGYRASVRTEGVLRMRDRHDASATCQAHCRLDADYAIGVRGTHNAAIRLRTERDRGEIRR